jgi:hypothetical protein
VKALAARIGRLEARLAPQEDLESSRLVNINILYERRRQRAEAAGEPFDDPPPERRTAGPRLSTAETLRRRRQQACERNERELAPGAPE